jgi:hypothetical protein
MTIDGSIVLDLEPPACRSRPAVSLFSSPRGDRPPADWRRRAQGKVAVVAEQSGDQRSRLQDYQERLERLMETAREEVGRQAPEVLDKLAATARNIGQRLDEMAADARRTRAETQATTSEPVPESSSSESPASSGESGPAGA